MLESTDSKDEILIKYILNETSKDENEDLEDEMVLDDQLSDRMQTVEMLLIERYVLQAMSPVEKTRFEQGFLLFPENRNKVEDARIFHESIGLLQKEGHLVHPPKAQKQSWGAWLNSWFGSPIMAPAFAALALLLIGVIIFILFIKDSKTAIANGNAHISNNETPLVASQNENGDNNGNSASSENIERSGEVLTPAPKSPSAPPAPETAEKNQGGTGSVVVRTFEEKDGTAGQDMGNQTKNVPTQFLTIPGNSNTVRLSPTLTKTVITNSRSKIPVEIQDDKFHAIFTGKASPVRVPRAGQLPPQYVLPLDVPTKLLKDNEIYYFAIPSSVKPGRFSTTPFQITRTKP